MLLMKKRKSTYMGLMVFDEFKNVLFRGIMETCTRKGFSLNS